MKNNKLFVGMFILAMITSFSIPTNQNKAYADSNTVYEKTITFDESTEQSRSQVINIPKLFKITSISSDNGSASYSINGYNATINVSGGNPTRIDSKEASDYSTSIYGSFSSTLYYSYNGYSGTLYKDGDSYYYGTTTILSGSRDVSETRSSYSNNLPSYIYYDSGVYSGYLYGNGVTSQTVQTGGSYSTKYVENQTKQYYSDSQGYTGTLEKYEAVPKKTKYIDKRYSVTCIDHYIWNSKKKKWEDGSGAANFPKTYEYSDSEGYSGTLSYVPKAFSTCESNPPSGKGSSNGEIKDSIGTGSGEYTGTVTKPAVYRYRGTVVKDTRTYATLYSQTYSGTVYSYSEVPLYRQDYKGTVYKNYYGYNVNFKYIIDDESPTLNLSANTSWTNSNTVITATANDTQSGVNYIQTPDGRKVSGSSATYQATQNGTYTFKAVDKFGNEVSKSYTVDNIDRTSPTADTSVEREPLDDKATITIYNIQDADSGYDKVLLPNGEYSYLDTIKYEVTSPGTYQFIIYDKAGNQTTKSVSVKMPNISIEPSTTNWTNGSVRLTVKTQDISKMLLPNNSYTTSTSYTFTASKNGVYTFIGYDSNGNVVKVVSYVVRNIDSKGKEGVIIPNDGLWKTKDFNVEVKVYE